MHDPVPFCGVAPPASTSAGPRVTTSVYETHLGLAAFTWSRTSLGISLHVDLRLPSVASAASSFASSSSDAASSLSYGASTECDVGASFRFRLRPWLLWRRRGSKRFHPKEPQQQHSHPVLDCAWDLSHARFPPGGGPEPAARFFVAVAVDGEMLLVVGDMAAEAYKKTKASRDAIPIHPSKQGTPSNPALISRREHVVLPRSGGAYTTRARVAGKEREITIELTGQAGAKLSVGLDGERALHVKRLRWKFRGSEEVEVGDGGARVQLSWDVHEWLFNREPQPPAPTADGSTSETGHALLLFRFNREEAKEEETGDAEACLGSHSRSTSVLGGGRLCEMGDGDRSSCSISGGGLGSKRLWRKRSLLKTMSSSSSSSASSSGSTLSVMEWPAAEEGELQGSEGFSLLVCVWKS